MSVLLEKTLPVKLIRNYIRDPSAIFSTSSSQVKISMTSFPFCEKNKLVYTMKTK